MAKEASRKICECGLGSNLVLQKKLDYQYAIYKCDKCGKGWICHLVE